ncbi:hypothetical protein CHAB381_0544 [Campylobacter hominis ATCC BAA-381]|uniref:Uncharacterized protein n=1 Tax=Campylobacter hominis (strain ATCC BAA-381 / DSM 21671 / CCUG 45161 / LMG 19568 / NCTC 13146 / CH001A) TaxID=360107 RepID=A7I0U1_CAMHC|nr:hypothetical protein CHAB381_0544 [Campylobacter hominis ATCC BAA-381]
MTKYFVYQEFLMNINKFQVLRKTAILNNGGEISKIKFRNFH